MDRKALGIITASLEIQIMNAALFTVWTLVSSFSIQPSSITVDLNALIGKSKTDLAAVLGAETGQDFIVKDNTCQCPLTLYKHGRIAVFFRDDKPDWIYFYGNVRLKNLATAKIKAYFRDPGYQRVVIQSLDPCCSPI